MVTEKDLANLGARPPQSSATGINNAEECGVTDHARRCRPFLLCSWANLSVNITMPSVGRASINGGADSKTINSRWRSFNCRP